MVSIREIKENESIQLAKLINGDDQIRSYLGFSPGIRVEASDVLKDIKDWQSSRSAECYGIFQDRQFTGMISLSHIDPDSGTGRIGYWLGSDYRGLGICSKAFELVIGKARALGLNSVSSTIDKTNKPSISIWKRRNARSSAISPDKDRYTLEIKRRPVVPSGGKGRI